jgi:Sigma-70, region 4
VAGAASLAGKDDGAATGHCHDTTVGRRVPEPFREAIVLREINNLSYQEIAQIAGVPVGTVMSRLARARAMLRAAWKTAETVTTRPGPAVASGTAL